MEQSFGKFLMFENRLKKVYKHLHKQAQRQNITCFRVYDHDLPEFPFIIEQYEDKLYASEYKRNHKLSDDEHAQWLEACKKIMAAVINIPVENIFLKLRKRKENRLDQYQKLDEEKQEFIVWENGLKFIVNLSDYLDTGLFLDHRSTRQMVRAIAAGKTVLNLFCYTGSFSIYAADGGASRVISVDLSKTYLHWAQRNAQINNQPLDLHAFVHADVMQYLSKLKEASIDIIVMDPPTFSNSKRMNDILDIQHDHVPLINECMRILSKDGVLFFSTNYTKFHLHTEAINASVINDITKATTPFDFAGKLHRQCFRIHK